MLSFSLLASFYNGDDKYSLSVPISLSLNHQSMNSEAAQRRLLIRHQVFELRRKLAILN
jgi:hypothetical protein